MISAFKNEEGSTTLAVVVALAVAVCLLSISVQWYWINSSAGDVQLAADLGAMAEEEAIGRTVLLMQIIDVTILSANLLGLVLHALVVVGGIATAAEAPIGGGVGASLLSQLIDIDKTYVERRKQFVDMLYSAAIKLNQVTPYLAFGYARRLVDENNDLRVKFNKTRYGVIPVPFPFQGSVRRASRYSRDGAVLDQVLVAHEDNSQNATALKNLSEKVESLKKQCFSLDCYKNEPVMTSSWKVEDAVSDFSYEFENISTKAKSQKNTLVPIEATSNEAQTRLNEEFVRNTQQVGARVDSAFSDAFGASVGLNVHTISSEQIFGSYLDREVFLVPHNEGQRKAYHADPACSGLYNAQSAPEKIVLQSVYGHIEHPPCSICLPFSWQAVSVWKEGIDPFIVRWNAEANAIISYAAAQKELSEKQSELQTNTQSSLNALLAEAQSMLASDRLIYNPPGSRGVLCIGYSQKQIGQPGFTLSRLTHTDNEAVGMQYAVSAARLKPLPQTGYVPKIILSQKGDYSPTNMRFGSAVFAFLNGDSGLFNSLSSLWYGVTNFYTKGASGLEDMFNKLPWGIGTIATNFMGQLQKYAGVSKPDIRTYRPFLVNTSEVGDPDASGIEGSCVSQIRSAKQLYNRGAKVSESTIASLARNSLATLPDSSFGKIYSHMFYSVFSATCSAPFSMSLASYSSSSIESAKQAVSALGW